MPQTALTPAIRDEIERLGRADIMVGIPSFKNAATIGYVVRAAQAGLVQYFPDLRPVVVNSDAGSPDGTGRVVVETEPPDYVERILLVRPTNKLQRVSLTYPEIEGTGGKAPLECRKPLPITLWRNQARGITKVIDHVGYRGLPDLATKVLNECSHTVGRNSVRRRHEEIGQIVGS
jgi:hypothetical protein